MTQKSCRDRKPSPNVAPLSRHQNWVVTPKAPAAQHHVATLNPLSRHRASHLCHNKEFSVATEHPRELVAIGLPRHARLRARKPSTVRAGTPVMHAVAPTVATLLQCHDPKLEMGSSPPHLLPCTFLFLFLFYILLNQHKLALLLQRPLEPRKLSKMYLLYKKILITTPCSLQSTKTGFSTQTLHNTKLSLILPFLRH